MDLASLTIVFLAGLITGLATGLGVLPFYLIREVNDRWLAVLWGLAVGILLSASIFGLVLEGIASGPTAHVLGGLVAGAGFVYLADRVIAGWEFSPRTVSPSTVTPATLVLTVGVLTIHSIPEGIAVGVAFADLGVESDVTIAGIGLPSLAIVTSVTISILNVPEGLAIAIPLIAYGMARWKVVGWAIVSGLPQPIGAVAAYVSVTTFEGILPMGFGFAAGALFYLIYFEFLPAGLDHDPENRKERLVAFASAATVGFVGMLAITFVIG